MKITSGYEDFDTSEYIKGIDIVQIHKTLLTKKLIKKNNKSIISLILSTLTSIFFICISISGFLLDLDFSLIGKILVRIIMIGVFVLSTVNLVSIPFAIKKTNTIAKKLKGNDFVLVKTKITHIHEDLRPADRDASANSYLLCDYCVSNTQKRIKVAAIAIDAWRFESNPTAYLLFTTCNDLAEGIPYALYYGKNYSISSDIKVLS